MRVCRLQRRPAGSPPRPQPGSRTVRVPLPWMRRAGLPMKHKTLHRLQVNLKKRQLPRAPKTQRPQPRRRQKRLNRHPRPHAWLVRQQWPPPRASLREQRRKLPGKPPRKTPMSKPSALHVPPAPARKKPRRRRLKLRPLLVRLHLRRRRLRLDNLPRKPPEVQPQRRLNNRHCAILKDACRVARFHRRNSTRR